MNIFIELPTWLGDTVMATPAVEELINMYPEARITFFGSFVSIEALKNHPNCLHVEVDKSKKSKFRFFWLLKKTRELGTFDLALSFRSSLTSSVFLWLLNAKKKNQYKKNIYDGHQVEKYAKFTADALHVNLNPKGLRLYQKPHSYTKPTLGINPGATYGSAKRWYPDRFAKVAASFSNDYDIVIFGGPNEIDTANEVEAELKTLHVNNYKNLAGKTTVTELISKIAGLSLFITNDSGPMHIAAAYQIPTVALFGPTKYKETCQWKNEKGMIIRHELPCVPCMKRTCPLKTHECMKKIESDEVIDLIRHHLSLDR